MFETLQKYMSDDETARFLAKNPTATVEPKKTQQKRNYSAARVDRTTADWITSATTVNQVLRLNLRWLRQRSRDLARNDPYAKKYFRLVKSNVIGVGIKLQIRTNDKNLQTDAKLTSSVERSFKEWTKKKNCTLSGKLSWLEAQKLFVTYLARDGEALVRIVRNRDFPYGISLQALEADRLDENMNMELQKPKHLISLASSAVLVSIDTNVWSATKQDRGISNEVSDAKKAVRNAGKYTKHLLADHPKHKAIVNYRQTIYNWTKRRTYRWNDANDLLPSIDVPRFKQEFSEHKAQFDKLVDEFLSSYSSIVSDMAFSAGDMFNRSDYPAVDELRRKFGVELYVSEVPMSDFRCGIANDIADDLFETYRTSREHSDRGDAGSKNKAHRSHAVNQPLLWCGRARC